MRLGCRLRLQCNLPFGMLCIGFVLITVGCSTTNNSGNCDAQGGANAVNCSQPAQPSKLSSSQVLLTSPPSSSLPAPPPNGTQLAAYSFDLPITYWAPLGLTTPTRAQLTNNSELDIQYNGELYFRANEQVLALPNSSVPTYQACANNNQIVNGGLGLNAARGIAFCVVEGGTIAGVEVGSVNNNPAYVVLNVTIWQNT
jgi:hypothetical protein